MTGFILRRIFQSMLVMLAVALIAFVVIRFVGDPLESLTSQETRLEDREIMMQRLGLDRPVVFQFTSFVQRGLSGDFGISYKQQEPVTRMIEERLPATLELALASATLALVLGGVLGIHCALKPENALTHFIMTASLIGVSLPTFLIGIGLIYLFSVELGWLPSFGRGETVKIGWWTTGLLTLSGWRSIILPAITLSLFQTTLLMRLIRAEMLEVLRQDYIRFARARGLPQRRIHFGHALKNTLVPVITVAGLQLGSVIAFAVVTETVFQWPGVGSLFINSVQSVDVPVMAAYLVFIALLFVLINLVVDILYYAVDPRLRVGHTSGEA
ncbi:ABC transporter permease [Aliirhizobium cellulosilyticum]|uniref:Peptide/nickel transport system permease protein/oligopeptide transport system permease protein n=1 Tax=Aliirhizobium cellulosilyticum TaxID=393664 RepID=A0A7W6Y3R2_9HYPH|nr:ABC transporter permease [Rhizobium cellulosilyticum]MBB4350636.1 peptide/nickel transport system permease protein/oligopeptide transport system permease protein [Rhizobium cellulosilyticum]MBB4413831.1 peptide/nickel transport system permease protein/oligopeptide transport system permease protein [Rhizobium cellulosilyticum]MBB4448446.1 peptide/nickel transport system permease protein/oligopeptide transport system permease protein [Rhizobium cellulosilyticum]